jgi:UDPglucose 6-dehydrogenase
MNALIVGHGFVGKATELTLRSLNPGLNISIHDPMAGWTSEPHDYDWVFICVPTDLTKGRKLSTKIVDEVYKQFNGEQIIRSTLPPEQVDKYPDATLWPEFLREVTFDIDATQPQVTDVIGVDGYYDGTFTGMTDPKGTFTDWLKYQRAVNIVSRKEAAMFKMSRNAFLSTKVMFANMLYGKCNELDINYENVKELLQHSLDATTHWDVPGPDGKKGFGGKCLPKDTSHYQTLSHDPLSSIVLLLNKYYREKIL